MLWDIRAVALQDKRVGSMHVPSYEVCSEHVLKAHLRMRFNTVELITDDIGLNKKGRKKREKRKGTSFFVIMSNPC